MIATQTKMPPPKPPTSKRIAAGFPDDIRELGDRIAACPKKTLKELARYLNKLGIRMF